MQLAPGSPAEPSAAQGDTPSVAAESTHDERSEARALETWDEGTERTFEGRLRVFYGGYWIKSYPVPADNLVEKRRLIAALTRRLFNHVEHGLYIEGARLDDAREAYDTETDSAKKRVKGGMLAGALFNNAADILTKLVELQASGAVVESSDPMMRRCGSHLQEALVLGKLVRHRTGEEGIDELWGEPFKAFAFPMRDFYHTRYVKLAMTLRCIDDISETAASCFEQHPATKGAGPLVMNLAEAAKDYAQSLRSDAEVFDCWATLAVAREDLKSFSTHVPTGTTPLERELSQSGVQLIREVCRLLFHIARARVPMPKSAKELCARCRVFSDPIKSTGPARSGRQPKRD